MRRRLRPRARRASCGGGGAPSPLSRMVRVRLGLAVAHVSLSPLLQHPVRLDAETAAAQQVMARAAGAPGGGLCGLDRVNNKGRRFTRQLHVSAICFLHGGRDCDGRRGVKCAVKSQHLESGHADGVHRLYKNKSQKCAPRKRVQWSALESVKAASSRRRVQQPPPHSRLAAAQRCSFPREHSLFYSFFSFFLGDGLYRGCISHEIWENKRNRY